MPKIQVRILNSAHAGGFTSLKNAKRYVRRGHARWVQARGPTIEFLEVNPAFKRVNLSEPARIDGLIDNRRRPATREEQRHVPLIFPQRPRRQRRIA